MVSPENQILQRAQSLHSTLKRPILVAIDGGSGSGKTTIANKFASLADVVSVPMDDFYQTEIPEFAWPGKTAHERLRKVFDWDRLRNHALIPLLNEKKAVWRPFDFQKGLNVNGTYSLQDEAKELAPAAIILLEGAYSASAPLSDLIDLSVLIDVPVEERHQRVALREKGNEAFLSGWHSIWDEVELLYFGKIATSATFDLVISN